MAESSLNTAAEQTSQQSVVLENPPKRSDFDRLKPRKLSYVKDGEMVESVNYHIEDKHGTIYGVSSRYEGISSIEALVTAGILDQKVLDAAREGDAKAGKKVGDALFSCFTFMEKQSDMSVWVAFDIRVLVKEEGDDLDF